MIISEIYEKATDLRVKALLRSRELALECEDAFENGIRKTLPTKIGNELFSYLRGKTGKQRTRALIRITAAALALAWDSYEPDAEQEVQ